MGDEEFRCVLCRESCRASVARQATLGGVLAARFRELQELISVYKDLIQLRSPARSMLLGRMRGCLEDVARIESLDPQTVPEADLEQFESVDTDDYDEDERAKS